MGQGIQKDAEDAYLKGDFAKATELYSSLVKQTPSKDAFFALGNAAHKSGDNATSVAAFLKARSFAPRDADVAYNLNYTLAKIQDKASADLQLPWYQSIFPQLNSMEFLGALLFILGLMLGVVGAHLYFKNNLTKAVMVTSLLLGGIFEGIILYQGVFPQNWGAIKGEKVALLSGPGSLNTKLYELSNGAPGLIGYKTEDWVEFILTDGKKAWVKKENAVIF